MRSLRGPVASVVALAALTLSACGTTSDTTADASATTLTLYNAQHEALMQPVIDAFEDETGIAVQMRNGDDSELSNLLVQEGEASPADLFVTENSPGMSLVSDAGLFAELDQDTLEQTPTQYQPTDGTWVGFAARSTVLVYDARTLDSAGLPASLMDLADPVWEGRLGISPAGADFQAIVSAVVQLEGEDAAAAWLAGLKANAKIYDGNSTVMKAVNAGEIDAGVVYHYYWYQDRAEGGDNSANVELHYFGDQDPGAFLSVSGAGVLASSEHPAEAQQFVAFLTSAQGQAAIAGSKALEYTIASDAESNPALPPLSDLDPPVVDPTSLNGPLVVELMQQAGLL
ncbi:iron ABC transporter substrate-binding protein [Pengzhenrongella frigida]|uniref:Iron ABC transporter substrate-binding protein n=1 Tax=Pengzhenrongella frigida TaxID=1259133 RepID=A0A4Q5N2U0_9MICO|nr:iron ABC transporter substrate-binding protein [Cellulomonas sp. HLT2-17]RYV50917.1 iron ABC transporter substrate-binding protein [Cellulomonas sp. HLT2-17]